MNNSQLAEETTIAWKASCRETLNLVGKPYNDLELPALTPLIENALAICEARAYEKAAKWYEEVGFYMDDDDVADGIRSLAKQP